MHAGGPSSQPHMHDAGVTVAARVMLAACWAAGSASRSGAKMAARWVPWLLAIRTVLSITQLPGVVGAEKLPLSAGRSLQLEQRPAPCDNYDFRCLPALPPRRRGPHRHAGPRLPKGTAWGSLALQLCWQRDAVALRKLGPCACMLGCWYWVCLSPGPATQHYGSPAADSALEQGPGLHQVPQGGLHAALQHRHPAAQRRRRRQLAASGGHGDLDIRGRCMHPMSNGCAVFRAAVEILQLDMFCVFGGSLA